MRNDAIDVKVNEGLLAFGAEEEGAVGGVVHEEIFGEDGGARCAWCRQLCAGQSGLTNYFYMKVRKLELADCSDFIRLERGNFLNLWDNP